MNSVTLEQTLTTCLAISLYSTGHWIGGTVAVLYLAFVEWAHK